jgi:HEAT repeat protein
MNDGVSPRLQRGALMGLALLLFSVAATGELSYLEVKRQLRNHSFIVIDDDGEQKILLLYDHGPTTIPARVEPIQSDDALVALAEKGGPLLVSRLAAALSDPSRRKRIVAIQLLGEMDSVEARMSLEPMLADPEIEVRLEVVEAIADTPGAEPLLELASSNDSGSVAATAREYLAERSTRYPATRIPREHQ